MVIDMNDEQLKTLVDLQGFLDGTVPMDFAVSGDERYEFIARTVKRFGYGRLKRSDKAIVLRFLERVSGYLRQQIARLVKRGGERRAMVKRYRGSRTSFARTYLIALTSWVLWEFDAIALVFSAFCVETFNMHACHSDVSPKRAQISQ
jgi:hypothetical protein